MFNRRWIEAVNVLRSTKPLYVPPIYDRRQPGPTAVVVKESAPPSVLATRGVTIEDHLESSQVVRNSLRQRPLPLSGLLL